MLDPDWLTVAYPEKTKLQENHLPDSHSDQTAFCPQVKYSFIKLSVFSVDKIDIIALHLWTVPTN